MSSDFLEKLKAAVFDRQKVLAEIYKQKSKSSLFDYVNSWQVGNLKASADFIGAAKTLLEKLYPDIANDVVDQLENQPLVSTIDHHGVLNHPFFINSNLIFSLRQGQKYLICLPTAGVSLNNSSWPGSLMHHDGQGNFRRASFFADGLKHLPALAAPPITKTGVNNFELVTDLPIELFSNEAIFNFSSFTEQASILSSKFWSAVFPSAPRIIYLPLEDLASSIIAEVIGKNEKHILHKLIFTEAGWQLLEKYFRGLKGAFDDNYGTFLFWAIDKKGQRQRIIRGKDNLELLLQPESLIKRLREKTLYPGSLLCFLVLLHSHITCLGGFNQVNWLTEIKGKCAALLNELGESSEAEGVAAIPTDNFAEGNFAFLQKNGKLIKPAALDIYLANDPGIYIKYQALGKIITVGESIETLLPEIYKIITPLAGRQQALLAISEEQILEASGLSGRVLKVLSA